VVLKIITGEPPPLRAEKDIDRNMTAEYDNVVKERNQ